MRITSFLNNERLNLSNLFPLIQYFLPKGGVGEGHHNLDGILTYCSGLQSGSAYDSYSQLFFNGAIEAVDSDIVRGEGGARVAVGGIASVAYERQVIEAVGSYFRGYKELGVAPPVAISMALLGCEGSYLHVDPRLSFRFTARRIDRDTAILPDVVAESLDENVAKLMKPIFDAVWNACGYPRSLNYNDKGEWAPRR